MVSEPDKAAHGVRYQPDERPPWPLAVGLALQYSVLAIGGGRAHRRDRAAQRGEQRGIPGLGGLSARFW